MHRTARGPIVPFITVICVLLAGAAPARAGKTAQVEVGFVGVPPPNFQNVLLNVQSVRINPKASAGPGNSKWQNIPVPPGIQSSGTTPADLQIDLNTAQNIPQIFNTAGVQPGTYEVAELLLDPNNPGTLIPNCPSAPPLGSANDGCINYPIQLAVGTNPIRVSNTGSGGLIQPGNGKVTPLILQVTMAIIPPTTPSGAYTATVTLAALPTSVLGIVQGSVSVGTGSGTSASRKVRKLAVTAEAIGTNTPIATALVKNGQYNLELPAAGGDNASALGFGTLYDLALAGGADSYQATRLLPLYPGQSINANFTPTGGRTLGSISGTISDNCVASKAISGATLQLLIPPDSISSPSPAFCIDSPEQCVTVATTYTDSTGNFPFPAGGITTPAEFSNVPSAPKSNVNGAYAMEITAPGYDPLIVQVKPSGSTGGKKGGTCACPSTGTPPYPCTLPTGTTFAACNLPLNTGYISGSIPIIAPNPGQKTMVQVFAEDHGTNNIESSLPTEITVTNSNVGTCPPGSPISSCVLFTLNVPPSVPIFDLFATTRDSYQGATDPYQGHTTAVLSGVTGPAEPSGHSCNTVENVTFEEPIECVGHGSVIGTVANPNLGTSVVLGKQDPVSGDLVQITNTLVQNQSANTNPLDTFAFCAPADTYQVQRLQLPVPDPSATPTAMPTPFLDGSPVTFTIPTPLPYHNPTPTVTATATGGPTPTGTGVPTATPTPTTRCPTTCSNPDGSCPGICNTVNLSPPGL